VLQAVRRPRHGLEPGLFDRLAIDGTSPERAVVDSLQRGSHLVQKRTVGFGLRQLFFLQFVDDARIAGVVRRSIARLAAFALARLMRAINSRSWVCSRCL